MSRNMMMASKNKHGKMTFLRLNDGSENSSFCQNVGMLAA
jgi:hypothetical protein